jgi:excisionase family DNA binding protein
MFERVGMRTYTFIEAAKVLNTSETTLSELLTNGAIPAAKFGQSWCIAEESLDAYLRSEIERQTVERLECIKRGVKPHAATARGSRRTYKPNLEQAFS